MSIQATDRVIYDTLVAVGTELGNAFGTGDAVRIWPALETQPGDLEFPTATYRLIGGEYLSGFRGGRLLRGRYTVRFCSDDYDELSRISDVFLSRVAPILSDLDGPFDIVEKVEGRHEQLYARSFTVLVKIAGSLPPRAPGDTMALTEDQVRTIVNELIEDRLTSVATDDTIDGDGRTAAPLSVDSENLDFDAIADGIDGVLGSGAWRTGGGGTVMGITHVTANADDFTGRGTVAMPLNLAADVVRDADLMTAIADFITRTEAEGLIEEWAETGQDATLIPDSKLPATIARLTRVNTIQQEINTLEGVVVGKLDATALEPWANTANATTLIPDSKIPAGITRDTELTNAIANFITATQALEAVEVWAQAGQDSELVPDAKIAATIARDSEVAAVSATVTTLQGTVTALDGEVTTLETTVEGKLDSDDLEDFANTNNASTLVPDSKISTAIARVAALTALINTQGVPSGGTAGQILSKINANDYATRWIDAPTGTPGTPGMGLDTDGVNALIADWAETGNTQRLPLDKITQAVLDRLLPDGGDEDQILAKSDDADYQVEWVNAPDTGITLAELDSLVFNWARTTSTELVPEARISAAITRDTELTAAVATLNTRINGLNADVGRNTTSITTLSGRVLPDSGDQDQILAKDSSGDYDVHWVDAPAGLPIGGTRGQLLGKNTNVDHDVGWFDPPSGGGLDTAQVNALIAAANIMDSQIPSTITRDTELVAQIAGVSSTIATKLDADDLEGWANTNNPSTLIPDAKLPAGITRDTELTTQINARGLPSGGTAGQVLVKDTGTNYDVSWSTPSSGGLNTAQVNALIAAAAIADSQIPSSITRDTELNAQIQAVNNSITNLENTLDVNKLDVGLLEPFANTNNPTTMVPDAKIPNIPDAKIPSTITRDTELASAIANFQTASEVNALIAAASISDSQIAATLTRDSELEAGLAARGLPRGGTAGQLLSKTNANDYATRWIDAPSGGGGGGGSGSGTPVDLSMRLSRDIQEDEDTRNAVLTPSMVTLVSPSGTAPTVSGNNLVLTERMRALFHWNASDLVTHDGNSQDISFNAPLRYSSDGGTTWTSMATLGDPFGDATLLFADLPAGNIQIAATRIIENESSDGLVTLDVTTYSLNGLGGGGTSSNGGGLDTDAVNALIATWAQAGDTTLVPLAKTRRVWYTGTAAPNDSVGKNEDYFLRRNATGHVSRIYMKSSGAWGSGWEVFTDETLDGSVFTWARVGNTNLVPEAKVPRVVYSGTTAPVNSLGKENDHYIRYTTTNPSEVEGYYIKGATAWGSERSIPTGSDITTRIDARVFDQAITGDTTRWPKSKVPADTVYDADITPLRTSVTNNANSIAALQTSIGTFLTQAQVDARVAERVPNGGSTSQVLAKASDANGDTEWVYNLTGYDETQTGGFSFLGTDDASVDRSFTVDGAYVSARDDFEVAILARATVVARTQGSSSSGGNVHATINLRAGGSTGGIIATRNVTFPGQPGSNGPSTSFKLEADLMTGSQVTVEVIRRSADQPHTGTVLAVSSIRMDWHPDLGHAVSFSRPQNLQQGQRRIARDNIQATQLLDNDGNFRRDVTLEGGLLSIVQSGTDRILTLGTTESRTGHPLLEHVYSATNQRYSITGPAQNNATNLTALLDFTSRELVRSGRGITYDPNDDHINVTEAGSYNVDFHFDVNRVGGNAWYWPTVDYSVDGGTNWVRLTSFGLVRGGDGDFHSSSAVLHLSEAVDDLLFRTNFTDNTNIRGAETLEIRNISMRLTRLAEAQGDSIYQFVPFANSRTDGAAVGLEMDAAGRNNSRLVHYVIDNSEGGVDIELPDSLDTDVMSATVPQNGIWALVTILSNEHPVSIHDHRSRQSIPGANRLHVYSDLPSVPTTAAAGNFGGQYWLGASTDRAAPQVYPIYWNGTNFELRGQIRASANQSQRELTQQRNRWPSVQLDLSESKTAAAFQPASARTWSTTGANRDKPEIGWSVSAIRDEISDYQHPTGTDLRIPIQCWLEPSTNLLGLSVHSAFLVRRATQDHAQAGIVVKLVNNRPNGGASNNQDNPIVVGLTDKFFFSLPDVSDA